MGLGPHESTWEQSLVFQCVCGFCTDTYHFVSTHAYRVHEEKLTGDEKLSSKVVQTKSFRLWAYICLFFPYVINSEGSSVACCRYVLTRKNNVHTDGFWPSGFLVA